jgi:hypothetical protein
MITRQLSLFELTSEFGTDLAKELFVEKKTWARVNPLTGEVPDGKTFTTKQAAINFHQNGGDIDDEQYE